MIRCQRLFYVENSRIMMQLKHSRQCTLEILYLILRLCQPRTDRGKECREEARRTIVTSDFTFYEEQKVCKDCNKIECWLAFTNMALIHWHFLHQFSTFPFPMPSCHILKFLFIQSIILKKINGIRSQCETDNICFIASKTPSGCYNGCFSYCPFYLTLDTSSSSQVRREPGSGEIYIRPATQLSRMPSPYCCVDRSWRSGKKLEGLMPGYLPSSSHIDTPWLD